MQKMLLFHITYCSSKQCPAVKMNFSEIIEPPHQWISVRSGPHILNETWKKLIKNYLYRVSLFTDLTTYGNSPSVALVPFTIRSPSFENPLK